MRKFAQDVLILSSAIIFSITVGFYFQIKLETNAKEKEVLKDKLGNLKYSYGNCVKDQDCEQIGCSRHFCSSDRYLATTCDYLADYPDKTQYECGCVNQKCSWFKK